MTEEILQLYEKMGCSLEVKIDNRGRGQVTAKVLFLESETERASALNVINALVQAALQKMNAEEYYKEDDGEVHLGESDEMEEDEDDFGVKVKDKRRK